MSKNFSIKNKDDTIDKDNEVRTIDMFVDSFDVADMRFRNNFIENGRPAHNFRRLLNIVRKLNNRLSLVCKI